MAKLLHGYWWFVMMTALVSGVSLFIWLHDEAHNHGRLIPDSIIHLSVMKHHRAITQLRSNETFVRRSNSSHSSQASESMKIPKVYIYSLPAKFNADIQTCLQKTPGKCIGLENYGFGNFLYKEGDMAVYNSNHFALEVILHHQLNNSQYRTLDPREADVFYIPSYLGTMFFCSDMRSKLVPLEEEMFDYLKSLPIFNASKPHLSTLAKIEREMSSKGYPLLQNPNCRKVTYITIEKEAKHAWHKLVGLGDQKLIVSPYPSYVHRDNTEAMSQAVSTPGLQDRKVFVFLAASTRRSNHFRARILDIFKHKVHGKSYQQYSKEHNSTGMPSEMMLVTQECYSDHVNVTIDWMENSVFCLQPHGDSPTRKSFYDSIQSVCIPVIFKFQYETVEFPFQNVLNYTDFTVSIAVSKLQQKAEAVIDILKAIPLSEINRLHNNLSKVARQLQYSIPDVKKSKKYTDALDMIMEQVREIYHL